MIAVERKLGIPRSTLSGWFKDIKLSKKQKKRLSNNKLMALSKARKNAVLWHNAQKTKRLEQASQQAQQMLQHIQKNNKYILELALAILYMAEGRKTADMTSLGSSDVRILKFYLGALRKLFKIDETRLRCSLFLRADQQSLTLKRFWSRQLNVPLKNFIQIQKDKRTIGIKTYSHYKGVCAVTYSDISIKRRLVAIAEEYFTSFD